MGEKENSPEINRTGLSIRGTKVHSIEFETLASNENLKQKKCSFALPSTT